MSVAIGSISAVTFRMAVWAKSAFGFLRSRSGPGVSLPPTLIFVLGFLAALVVHTRVPLALGPPLSHVRTVIGLAGAAAGLVLFAWAWRTLSAARTGIMLQQAATRIVERGPYRWSRNPMYVAFVMSYAGLAVALNTAWPFLVLPVVLVLLEHFVIGREERYLRRTFGEEYRGYCRRVRRWR